MISRITIIIALLAAFYSTSFGQVPAGGIFISDNQLGENAESSLLHLDSDNKGVLVPRMSFENLQAINAPADGLLAFVTGSSTYGPLAKGFYYYDSLSRQDWVRLSTSDDVAYQSEPIGTIVGFAGDIDKFFDASGNGMVGTDFEGWHICNGVGTNVPDLTNRFLVGAMDPTNMEQRLQSSLDELASNGVNTATISETDLLSYSSDYEIIGQSGGNGQTIILQKNQLPVHSHGTKTFDIIQETHTHEINIVDHRHKYIIGKGRKGNVRPIRVRDRDKIQHRVLLEEPQPSFPRDQTITVKDRNDVSLTISFPECAFVPFGADSPDEIEIQPFYYSLVYIIKLTPSITVYEDVARNGGSFQIYSGSNGELYSIPNY